MRVSGILNLSTLLKHVRVQQERVDSLFTPDSMGTGHFAQPRGQKNFDHRF